jgi:hypothetical protein
MGIDRPDIGANVRVYGNGKFRNKNATSGTQADLSIIPSSGNTRQYLDLQISNWTASNKQWIESSNTLGPTAVSHSVSGLTPDTNYDIYYTKDSGLRTKLNTVKADSSGRISFTYGNGFSTVAFEVMNSYNKADLNQDGCVDNDELTAFITRWYMSSTDVTLKELMEAIGWWKRGC